VLSSKSEQPVIFSSTLKMEEICSSEYLVNFGHIIWRYVLLIIIVSLNDINRYLKKIGDINILKTDLIIFILDTGGYGYGLDD
jgi:hypothetical protein